MITEWVSLPRAARELGMSVAECARLVVHGELSAQLTPGVSPSSRTVRVSAAEVARVKELVVDPRGSVADLAEADRILARRNTRSGWPPEGWSVPARVESAADVAESVMGVVVASEREREVDHTERVWRWLFEHREFEVPVSVIRKHFTGVGRVVSVARLEEVLTELEVLGVLGFVKIRRQGPGPRPRGVRLSLWVWGLVQAGRWVSVVRLREGEGVLAE